jgi:chromate transport protein ChrA
LIDANALRWLLIIIGLAIATLTMPPAGLLGLAGLVLWFIVRMSQRFKARRQARQAAQSVYWTPERIQRRFYA